MMRNALAAGLTVALLGSNATAAQAQPIRVVTTALVKGNMLIVTFDSSDARAKKDQVIALFEARLEPLYIRTCSYCIRPPLPRRDVPEIRGVGNGCHRARATDRRAPEE